MSRRKFTEEDYQNKAELLGVKYLGPYPKSTRHKTWWICGNVNCEEKFYRSNYNVIFKKQTQCLKCSPLHNALTAKEYHEKAASLGIKFLGPIPEGVNKKTNWTCSNSGCDETFYRSYAGVAHNKQTQCLKCSPIGSKFGAGHHGFLGYGEISGEYYAHVKRRAEEKNIPFSISVKYTWDLFLSQNKKCTLTNLELITPYHKNSMTASLDRIDSSKGYIEGNVQWVHKDINKMKMDLDEKYFIKMCYLVSNAHDCKNINII